MLIIIYINRFDKAEADKKRLNALLIINDLRKMYVNYEDIKWADVGNAYDSVKNNKKTLDELRADFKINPNLDIMTLISTCRNRHLAVHSKIKHIHEQQQLLADTQNTDFSFVSDEQKNIVQFFISYFKNKPLKELKN